MSTIRSPDSATRPEFAPLTGQVLLVLGVRVAIHLVVGRHLAKRMEADGERAGAGQHHCPAEDPQQAAGAGWPEVPWR